MAHRLRHAVFGIVAESANGVEWKYDIWGTGYSWTTSGLIHQYFRGELRLLASAPDIVQAIAYCVGWEAGVLHCVREASGRKAGESGAASS